MFPFETYPVALGAYEVPEPSAAVFQPANVYPVLTRDAPALRVAATCPIRV